MKRAFSFNPALLRAWPEERTFQSKFILAPDTINDSFSPDGL